MALALNNLKRVDMQLNKETNQTFNWIVSDTLQYLEPFSFVDLS